MAKLPPGPRSMLLTTIRVARTPTEAMTRYRDRYGDPFFLPMGNGPIVATAQPALIKELFASRDTTLYGSFGFESTRALVGEHTVLLMNGDEHKRERKLLMPPFHGDRMRAYGEVMIEATRAAFSEIDVGDELNALERTTRLSLEAIVRAVFGFSRRDEIKAAQDAVRAMLGAAKPILLFSPKTQIAPFGLGPWATFQKRSRALDELLYEQIRRTREDSEGREDILAMLVRARYEDGGGMADSEIRDELRTLLIAGHETTAVSLAWTLYALHRDPEILARARAEVDALGDDPGPQALSRLPYVGAVIDETLRRYPIVDVVFRKLLRPTSFAGYDLPAGVTLCPAIVLVHRDPSIYPDPLRFDPERFLGKKPRPHEYLPFGGGNRRCIGAAFSLYESRIAVATLLREFEFELLDGELPAVRKNIVLAPKGGVRLRLRSRRRGR